MSSSPRAEPTGDQADVEAELFQRSEKFTHSSLRKFLSILLGVLVIAAAGAGVYVYSTTRNGTISKYRLAKVERGPITSSVSASGNLNAVITVQVGSQISGMVKQISVDFNSPVKKDQLIARIDPETFEAKVNQARADLESSEAAVLNQRAAVEQRRAEVDNSVAALATAKANSAKAQVAVEDAKITLERKVDLLKRELISQSEKDTAQYAYESVVAALDATRAQEQAAQSAIRAAQAQLRVAEAQLRVTEANVKQKRAALAQAQVDLDHTYIRAPVNGVVVSRNVDVGQTVAASLQAPVLFTIAEDLTRMQVETSIDEADIGKVREGMETSFTVDAFPGETFRGQVVQIRKAPQVVQNVVTYIVVIAVANPQLKLIPGMTANVKLVVDRRENVLRVPNAALRFRPPGESAAERPQPTAPPQGAPQARPAQGGGSGSGAQQQEEFRQRLIAELSLTSEQQAKLETILAEQRQQIRAMFQQGLDDKAREAQRRRILGEGREKIREILTAEQKKKYEAMFGGPPGTGAAQAAVTPGRVFVIGSDGKPKAAQVMLGLSDGSSTEVVSGELKEGQEVITTTTDRQQPGPTQPRFRL